MRTRVERAVMMDTMIEQCLLAIVDVAIKANDNYALTVNLPVSTSDERNHAVSYLETHGFISQVRIMGPISVGCCVEEKALKYALKYYETR